MRVATVESTTLLTVSYDESRTLLQLEFCSGAVYQYFRVPAAAHQSLLAAPSKGRYFNQAIRGQVLPKYVSSDNDPLYRFHQWQANLRVLGVTEIKSVPYVPLSHPRSLSD